MILDLLVERPQFRAVVIEQGVADGQLVLPIAIQILGERIMARVALRLPKQLQIPAERPETVVTVLEHDVPLPSLAAEIAEVQRVTQDPWKAAARRRRVRGSHRCWYPGFRLSCLAVGDDQFHVLAVDDFVPSVAVEVVNLNADIVREFVVPGIRFADAARVDCLPVTPR